MPAQHRRPGRYTLLQCPCPYTLDKICLGGR